MNTRKIYVAEDEAIIAMDIVSILRNLGYINIKQFNDGKILLDAVLFDPPDLIIADILLKKNTLGTDCAEKLWENYNIPFIFISASINVNKYRKVYDPKKCIFISKPFKADDLISSINSLLHIS